MMGEGRAHPECINASNSYHECVEFCFKRIIEVKERIEREQVERGELETKKGSGGGPSFLDGSDQNEEQKVGAAENTGGEEHVDGDNGQPVEKNIEVDYSNLTGRQKKLFELRLKMVTLFQPIKINEARKANQIAMLARVEAPPESRGISKQKWIEERKKKIGKLLDANGLDMSKAYMLDTQETSESKYKKWDKDPAPFGWDVFNQKTLYNAYKKRTKNIECDMEEYNKLKEADPEFYRDASSLQYGKAPKTSEEKIDKMVKELKDWDEKRRSFSRR
ncbi:uncharacterized protein LOC131228817 [Magnolia sinica]|uniref:uncharacterized protein LOC131228817 n=1 Tax=Magnolia sinica TaxID=86752 RepID=UPI0026583AE1|nr:uncharacterized protein LOC131228817 [Magnolia sinica]